MNVLITGGNGFLGSNITLKCIELGYNVMIISRNVNNIIDILDKVIFIKYNSYLLHADDIHKFSPNIIIHTTWEGGNSRKDIDSITQFKNITIGTELLDVIGKLDTSPTFIGFGSFAEYGIINKKAQEIENECPDNIYGLSKYIFKQTSEFLCKKQDIKWVWLRPCYIYGNSDVHTRLIPNTIKKLLLEKTCVLDECNVIIDYLHVNDFCNAVISIIKTGETGIFNICSSNEYCLKDIVINIQTNIPGSNIIFKQTNNKRRYICGSNDRLKKIGWNQTISINDGILDTINKMKKHLLSM